MNYRVQGDCYNPATLYFIHTICHFDEELEKSSISSTNLKREEIVGFSVGYVI